MLNNAAWLLLTMLACSAAAAPAYDCEKIAKHRQFDFWVGQWNVESKDGSKQYGSNTINQAERGCLLTEQWKSASGGTGSSINYYNPDDGKWHQHWVDAGASIITISGGLEDATMVLHGDIYYFAQQRKAAFRGSWTPMPDGRVRQFFEEQDAEGKWQPWFEGFYRRSE